MHSAEVRTPVEILAGAFFLWFKGWRNYIDLICFLWKDVILLTFQFYKSLATCVTITEEIYIHFPALDFGGFCNRRQQLCEELQEAHVPQQCSGHHATIWVPANLRHKARKHQQKNRQLSRGRIIMHNLMCQTAQWWLQLVCFQDLNNKVYEGRCVRIQLHIFNFQWVY